MILLALGVLLLAAVSVAQLRLPALQNVAPFAAAAAVALAVTVVGWRLAPEIALYDPPAWGWYAAFVLTLIAFLCIGVFIFRGKLRTRLRAPLDLAVIFWALGHLIASGDAAGLVLFGGLCAASLLRLFLIEGRPAVAPLVIREGHDAMALIAGVAMFGVMSQLHQVYAGVPAFVIPGLGP